MGNELLDKLRHLQTKERKSIKKNLNPDSAFGTLTDEEISLVLAIRAKNLRISQHIKQSELSKIANLSSSTTYSNFEQKGTASLLNFIKICRSLGRLHELESLLQPSVSQKIEALENDQKQRVR